MFIGHYQLGDLLPLRVQTVNGSNLPSEPTAAPAVHVIDSSGSIAYATQLPIRDRKRATAYFHDLLNLDSRFSAGRYSVLYSWDISGTAGACVAEFEILAGGNSQGNGIAMDFFRQSAADFVLMQTDAGTIKKLKNPEIRNANA